MNRDDIETQGYGIFASNMEDRDDVYGPFSVSEIESIEALYSNFSQNEKSTIEFHVTKYYPREFKWSAKGLHNEPFKCLDDLNAFLKNSDNENIKRLLG